MPETRFLREDMVKKALEKYRDILSEKMSKVHVKQMRKEFDQITTLLVYLFLDLKLDRIIEEEYIPRIEEGYAKEKAKIALEVAKEISEET